MIFAEYAMDTADACRALGIKTVAVTAGYIHAEPRREFYAKMDAANVDLKAFTEEFYVKLMRRASAAGARHARLPEARDGRLVRDHDAAHPGQERLGRGDRGDVALDRARARHRCAAALHRVPSRLQDDGPRRARRLRRLRARARHRDRTRALRYVYTGNVHDTDGGTTFCPGCAQAVVVRDWHRILEYRVSEEGKCSACGTRIAGRYGAWSGQFGRRRIPVRAMAGEPTAPAAVNGNARPSASSLV